MTPEGGVVGCLCFTFHGWDLFMASFGGDQILEKSNRLAMSTKKEEK